MMVILDFGNTHTAFFLSCCIIYKWKTITYIKYPYQTTFVALVIQKDNKFQKSLFKKKKGKFLKEFTAIPTMMIHRTYACSTMDTDTRNISSDAVRQKISPSNIPTNQPTSPILQMTLFATLD